MQRSVSARRFGCSGGKDAAAGRWKPENLARSPPFELRSQRNEEKIFSIGSAHYPQGGRRKKNKKTEIAVQQSFPKAFIHLKSF